jgi:hypothetical protein
MPKKGGDKGALSNVINMPGDVMKKVIHGKLYDTNNAKMIVRHESSPPEEGSSALMETLYRTRQGNWFLHGRGGTGARWSRYTDNSYVFGEDIETLSEDAVREWCESREIDVASIAQYFDTQSA